MNLSLFVLGLYVFLQSAVYLAWFNVDPKLLGFIGIAFVIILIIETVLGVAGRPVRLFHRNGTVA